MNGKMMVKVAVVMLGIAGICRAGGCVKSLEVCSAERTDADSVEVILARLNQAVSALESYEGRVEYRFSQPILESQTLRKGVLYFAKCGEKSKLRINFQTLEQDDEREQRYIEQYIFDGVWLTHIDYQIKEVKRRQLAEPNEPVDAFELARRNFPIIGFSKTEDLKKEFEIKLQAESGPSEFIKLHLKVRPGSIYKDDYSSIDFWIDKKMNLPAKIVAISTEEDIYEIKLLEAKVNERIDEKVFEVKVPDGFGEEIVPLKRRTQDQRPKTEDCKVKIG